MWIDFYMYIANSRRHIAGVQECLPRIKTYTIHAWKVSTMLWETTSHTLAAAHRFDTRAVYLLKYLSPRGHCISGHQTE